MTCGRKILTFPICLLLLTFLVIFLPACGELVSTGSVTLSWDTPEFNEDDTALTTLAGYRIYFGQESGKYTDSVTISGNTTTAMIRNLPKEGTIYFAATAFNSYGNESCCSIELPVTLPVANWNHPLGLYFLSFP